ncbi:hypothetical protein HC256_007472 [Beauveria bassiana]|nr:hypothetical protein HC256_007472 [Beauveria bassiana]
MADFFDIDLIFGRNSTTSLQSSPEQLMDVKIVFVTATTAHTQLSRSVVSVLAMFTLNHTTCWSTFVSPSSSSIATPSSSTMALIGPATHGTHAKCAAARAAAAPYHAALPCRRSSGRATVSAAPQLASVPTRQESSRGQPTVMRRLQYAGSSALASR